MNAYRYRCGAGHEISSPLPLSFCPMVVRGCPCRGDLVRIGPGSRKAVEA